MVIRKVGIGSVVKVFGVLYGLLGFVVGAFLAMFALVGFGAAAAGNEDVPAWLGSLFGIGAVIVLPIVYGIMGVVGGVLIAALYNLVANLTGGLEIEVQ